MEPTKLRAFVLDRETRKPLRGVLLKARLSWSAKGQAKGEVELGPLSSDVYGYLSFDLDSVVSRLPAGVKLDSLTLFFAEQRGVGAEGEATEAELFDALAACRYDRPVLVWADSTRAVDGPTGIPSVERTDATDMRLSPGSFGMRPTVFRIGEAGCEELLHSRAPERVFHFTQIVRERKMAPGELGIAGLAPCEGAKEEFVDAMPALCYRLGAILHYEMTWSPIGHGLGELIYSLPLAPCEAVKVAIIDWTRTEQATRGDAAVVAEELIHSQRRDRAIEETVDATISEWQRGESWLGGNAGAGTFTFSQAYGMSGAHSFGYGTANTSGERRVGAETLQRMADLVGQASNNTRQLRSTVVVQSTQHETERFETRMVRNHNHGHAMTVLYYEVLRHYAVRHALASVQDALLVRYADNEFTYERIQRHRSLLRRLLLDPSLSAGFDAVDFLLSPDSRPTPVETPLVKLVVTLRGVQNTEADRVNFMLMTTGGDIYQWDSRRVNSLGPDDHLFQNGCYITLPITDLHTRGGRRVGPLPLASDIARVGVHFMRDGDNTWGLDAIEVIGLTGARSRPRTLFSAEAIDHRFGDDGYWWSPLLDLRLPASDALRRNQAAAGALVNHLRTNVGYYNRMLWLLEDPDTRARRFERYTLEMDALLPDGSRRRESGRLLDLIENRAVDVVGDYVVFPLAVNTGFARDLQAGTAPPVTRIATLPTRGTFAEAKLGDCNSCEPIDDTRFWDWQLSPCPDEPPDINDIAPQPRPSSAVPSAATVPTSSLSVEASPVAPDPSGLDKVLELLGRSDVFRDMSAKGELRDLLVKLADGAVELEKARLQNQTQREQNRLNAQAEFERGRGGESDGGLGGGSTAGGDRGVGGSIGSGGAGARGMDGDEAGGGVSGRDISTAERAIDRLVDDPEDRASLRRDLAERTVSSVGGRRDRAGYRVLRFIFRDYRNVPVEGDYMIRVTNLGGTLHDPGDFTDLESDPRFGSTSGDSIVRVPIPTTWRSMQFTITINSVSMPVMGMGDFASLRQLFDGVITTLTGSESRIFSADTAIETAEVDLRRPISYTFGVKLGINTRVIEVSGQAELQAEVEGQLSAGIAEIIRLGSASATVGGSVSGSVGTQFRLITLDGGVELIRPVGFG